MNSLFRNVWSGIILTILVLCCDFGSPECQKSVDAQVDPAALSGSNSKTAKDNEIFGAESNPTGDPIGGGPGYRRLVSVQDRHVDTADELLVALSHAHHGQVVYVNDRAEINLTGKKALLIPSGVTLASGRGRKNSLGALLFTDNLDSRPLFVTGDEVRITGLRIRGPDPEQRDEQMRQLYKEGKYYSIPNSDCIQTSNAKLEVDNCELWGWSHAAIFLKEGSRAYVHHNYIHHNQRQGLGYGLCLARSYALIEANMFDWCRHNVAGTGDPGTSYTARFNLILEHTNGYGFDMHGGKDRKDGTDIAGDSIEIYNNTFRAEHASAVVICGRPKLGAEIHHNWFLQPDSWRVVRQLNGVGNIHVYRNMYTNDRVIKD